jgi:hypothetical protein
MIAQSTIRRLLLGAATGLSLAIAGISAPIVIGALTPAYAQLSPDIQDALDQYGEWRRDPRYGDVWVPNGLPADWRPYEYGHWVYTDEWGWYWVSDDEEADWGWVVYHYGRWVHDRESWFWVPGDEWAPAWVDWRYGDNTVGWAPLPPDNVDIDAYEAEPSYWVFVPDRYIAAPRLRSHFVPRERREFFLRSTHSVNRTLRVNGARIAVNPGISPAFVARVTHAALPTYRVRPHVFGSTQGVSGAVQVRREDLHRRQSGSPGRAPRVNAPSVQRTTTVIKASTAVTAPAPLGKGEHGHLGSHPPRAAQGTGVQQQQQQQTAPSGGPPHPSPAPVIAPKPANPAVVPKQPSGTPQTQERREIHPPAGNEPDVQPNGPPPPKQPAPSPPRPAAPPPPVVHAPPPPVVHAPPPPAVRAPPPPAVHAPPPPVVHAPPPPAVHAPPPPSAVHRPPPAVRQAPPPAAAKPAPKPAAKPGEKPAEVPK